jgi:hypothetical protein
MTVGELRAVLENEWIKDDLVLMTYDDEEILEIVLSINKEGDVTEARFTYGK